MKIKSFFSQVVIILLLISPILDIYNIGGFSAGFFFMIICGILNLFIYGFKKDSIPFWLSVYLWYSYFSHIVASGSFSGIIAMRIIRIYIFYKMFFDNFNLDQIVKIYRRIAIICISFLAIQLIHRYLIGSQLYGVLSFLPLSRGGGEMPLEEIIDDKRDCSFFAEPAHFAQFLLPLLTIELFHFNSISFVRVMVIFGVLVLLQSGNALLGLLIIIVMFFFKYLFIQRGIQRFIILPIVAIFISVSGGFFYNSEMGDRLLSRREKIEDDKEISSFMRISRGYYVLDEYPTIYKVIGNDNPNFIRKMSNKSLVWWSFLSDDDFYYNGFVTILLYSGIIGLILFSIFCFKTYIQTDYCGKTLILIMLCLSAIAANYFSGSMTTCILLSCMMRKNDNYVNKTLVRL